PYRVFKEAEQKELKELPAQPLDYTTASRQHLPPDQHVLIEDNWYSAPYEYIGKKLNIYAQGQLVKIYSESKLIATHKRSMGKGERITTLLHYPAQKRFWLENTPAVCREKAGKVGQSCFEVVDALLSDKVQDRLPGVHRLLGFRDKYDSERLEKACKRAIYYNDKSYRRVKAILAAGRESDPIESDNELIPRTQKTNEFARDTAVMLSPGGVQ
ncbi:MAG: hypothetical protein U9P49_10640, partial [Thermodesulfobacteriota bacterium]|nr:hypothetical protein [Thermodesulfobacteriota bacterium]